MRTIRLYTTPSCGYCHSAKRLLKELNLPFEETDVAADPDLRMRLSAENGGYRTVPMIFIGDEFIGGFTDLRDLHHDGKLMEKVGAS